MSATIVSGVHHAVDGDDDDANCDCFDGDDFDGGFVFAMSSPQLYQTPQIPTQKNKKGKTTNVSRVKA